VASDIELHVTVHEDCDGRLKPAYMKISYSDVRRHSALQVIDHTSLINPVDSTGNYNATSNNIRSWYTGR